MNSEVEIKAVTGCPHCEQELSPEEIKTLWSNYTKSLRQTLGGPKRVPRACPNCSMTCETAREAWSHCRIPRNLDPAALLAYVLDRMPEELTRVMSHRYGSLETLHKVLTDLLETKPKGGLKRQAKWYLGYVDRALDKLEDVA